MRGKAGDGAAGKPATEKLRTLWPNIEDCLDSSPVDWRRRIHELGKERAVQERSKGRAWSDDEVFKAILLAVLSSNTVWSKVELVQADLPDLFCGFSLDKYARLSEADIDKRFVPWFKQRKAGAVSLGSGLRNLVKAAGILLAHSGLHGSADHYFTSLVSKCSNDPKLAALQLGGSGEFKLPSLGVALAAEALGNLGFDVAKPDRHVLRAMGSFGLVHFDHWTPSAGPGGLPGTPSNKELHGLGPSRKCRTATGGFPSTASTKKLLEVMTVAERIAEAAGKPAVLVDMAIWLLCARDELHLTNKELAELAP